MAQVQLVVVGDDVGFALALVRDTRHRRAYLVLSVGFNQDAILGQLFLDQDDFFSTLDDKVAPRVVGALLEVRHLVLCLVGKHAFR